jgi:hypothetical protein
MRGSMPKTTLDLFRRGRPQHCDRQPTSCMLEISMAKLADGDVNAHDLPTIVQSQHVTRHRLQKQTGSKRSDIHLLRLAAALEPLLALNLVCIHNQIVRVIGCARTPEEQFSQHLLKRRTIGDAPLQGFRERQQIPRYLTTDRRELQLTPSGSPEVVKGALQHSPIGSSIGSARNLLMTSTSFECGSPVATSRRLLELRSDIALGTSRAACLKENGCG